MGKQLEKLKQHLIEKEWKSADLQTKWALMELVGKSEGNLTPDEVKNISYSDLLEIDRLWNEADSRFGFRKQAMLISLHDYDHFVQKVSWRRNGEWKDYDDIFEGDFVDGQLPYIGSKFWARELTRPISHSHSYRPHHSHHPHRPHYHYHRPHQHNNDDEDVGWGIGAAAAAAAPFLLKAAALAAGGYLLYRWATKEEREREERRKKERQEELTKKRIISLLDPFLKYESIAM